MEALKIKILNPKAKKILQNLADLHLIDINKPKTSETDFKNLLSKLRSKSDGIPTIEEITKEVDAVRQDRYAKEQAKNNH
jgi:hypothetical protein